MRDARVEKAKKLRHRQPTTLDGLVGAIGRSYAFVIERVVRGVKKKKTHENGITYLCRCGGCALTRRRARRRTDVVLIFARRLVGFAFGGTLGYRRSSFRRCVRRGRSRFSVSFVLSRFSFSVRIALCPRDCSFSSSDREPSALFQVNQIHVKSDD